MKPRFSFALAQQLLAAAILIVFPSALLADPIYTHFEFGERYDKAARNVVPGFGVFSKTRMPPVNVKGWTTAKPKTTASESKKRLKSFQPTAKPKKG